MIELGELSDTELGLGIGHWALGIEHWENLYSLLLIAYCLMIISLKLLYALVQRHCPSFPKFEPRRQTRQ